MQQVTLPLKTNEECQKIYNRRVKITPNQVCSLNSYRFSRKVSAVYFKLFFIIQIQLCAGGEQGQDSCGGDSGG